MDSSAAGEGGTDADLNVFDPAKTANNDNCLRLENLGVAAAPAVVGTVYSPATLRAALTLPPAPAAPNLIELRADGFGSQPEALDEIAAAAPRPLIVTARRPDEGGLQALSAARRRWLYRRLLPRASYLDIEVRSLRALADVTAEARQGGCRIIASFHDFQGTPSRGKLREMASRAFDAGADVFKAATMLIGPGDLAILLDLLAEETRLPLAVMGMGPRLGRVSRLALAAAGSVLNYGFLGEQAQVPGQWPAAVLRERLDELLDGAAGESVPSEPARGAYPLAEIPAPPPAPTPTAP